MAKESEKFHFFEIGDGLQADGETPCPCIDARKANIAAQTITPAPQPAKDADPVQEPVAWLAEVYNKYQKRGGYDERIDVDEWRQTVMLNKPQGPLYRNIRPLYTHPATLRALKGENNADHT